MVTAGKEEGKIIMDVLDEFKRDGERKGRVAGMREGRVASMREGERKGRAQMLLDQLAVRFGRVPAAARARVLAAEEAALARWSVAVLTAGTLDAVLDGPATKAKVAKRAAPARSSAQGRKRPLGTKRATRA